ncbi:MAG: 30S ribosomal protein S12 methylthiotransferase RimO [Tepidisphaeraceae bacterium]
MKRSTKQSAPRDEAPIESVAFVSLGCPKNLVDSERMLGLLAQDGLAITPDHAQADAIVINTCGFLEASKDESLREIRDAVELKKKGACKRVIVAGCLVQRHKTKLLDEVPEIDRLVGVFDREHIVEAVRGAANPRTEHGHFLGKYHDLSKQLESASGLEPAAVKQAKNNRLPVFEDDRARLRLTPRHYAYLRISEGCNQGCAFCTIPSIRGPMRSKPVEQILAEGRELAADGAVELNLIGQDTTSFGMDVGYAPGLAGMLKALDKDMPRDVQWIRLMYAYPSTFSDDMIKALADSPRFVKYIDMPLQHISDRLLTLMKRRVTRNQIVTLLEKLRKWVPGMAIRTTYIAGSPTETEAEHQELVKFVREFGFDHLGVFAYSPEPGTPMGRNPDQHDDATKQRWVEEIMLAQQEVVFARNAQRIGTTEQVLIDRVDSSSKAHGTAVGLSTPDGAIYLARTQGQAPDIDSCVFVHSKKRLAPGELVTVKITDYQNYDLVAEVPTGKRKSLKVVSAK